MEKIRYKLELEGYRFLDEVRDAERQLTHLYFRNGIMLYSITAPHRGNKFQYLVRKNPQFTFDKWGNCDIEERYDTEEELLESWRTYVDDLEEIITIWSEEE